MDITQILKTVAPWIATAMAGPLGGLAVSAAADALGISDKTQEGIKAALSGATPEQMLALKNADQVFALKMQELGFSNIQTMERLGNEDRDSARKREMDVHDATPKVLAYLLTFGFFGMLGLLMFYEVPNNSRDIMNIMLGSLGTAWIGAVGYYHGSTSSSARKTELLSKTAVP